MTRFAGQVLTARQLADRYGVTDTDGARPDAWGYIATVKSRVMLDRAAPVEA